MADIKVVVQSKVKSIKRDFKKEFGLSIRIYDGRNLVKDDDNISEVRKNKGASKDITIAKQMHVGRLEREFKKNFGLKILIFTSDDKYHCDQKISLAEALRQDTFRKKQKEKYEIKSNLFKNLCKKNKLEPIFTHDKYDHTIVKIQEAFTEGFEIKCELWPNKIVLGYKLNDETKERIILYLKQYEINSTNKNEFIQIDDVLGNPFYIYKNILSYLLKITDSDNLIYLTKTNLAEESSEDNNTPENEDVEEVCVKLTPGKKCMYLDYTGINVENDEYQNTFTNRETISGYVVIKMPKNEYDEYDWEENVEFEVTEYEIMNSYYDVNGNEFIWEYEPDDEEVQSLENTIDEMGGVYDEAFEEYYEKNCYMVNEITAEIVNEADYPYNGL